MADALELVHPPGHLLRAVGSVWLKKPLSWIVDNQAIWLSQKLATEAIWHPLQIDIQQQCKAPLPGLFLRAMRVYDDGLGICKRVTKDDFVGEIRMEKKLVKPILRAKFMLQCICRIADDLHLAISNRGVRLEVYFTLDIEVTTILRRQQPVRKVLGLQRR